MKKIILLLSASTLLVGCGRNSSQVWEDTKTCSRYMGKGLRALFGHPENNQEVAYFDDQNWFEDAEFFPLTDAPESTANTYTVQATQSPGDPGSAIPGISGFSKPSGQLSSVFTPVHFDTDKYNVTGKENLKHLREVAHYLTQNPQTYIFVEGHADERGAAAYNLALGSRRANAIRSFLIQNGVNPNQLYTISYGKEKPVAMGHDDKSWSQNRRGQFRIYER